MVRAQAQRQHLAALGGSPSGRKPPLVRTDSPSPSGRKARKPQVDIQVLANEGVVVNPESENSAIVQATANNGDPATSGDPADVLNPTAGDPAKNVVVNAEREKSPIVQVHGSSSTAD